jgi:glycosyltransferase involved in cell wall biosynthesis
MITVHRALGTWSSKVDRYIALNDFCREQFIVGGLPRERICVKPNFVDVPPPGQAERRGFLFVGRLSKEKGVGTLAAASARLTASERVAVIGQGPESGLFDGVAGVELLGARDGNGVLDSMTKAAALIIPSIWYENFPRTLVESFACGLPVIASRLGALETLIDDGVNGLLFTAGDEVDLAAKMNWAAANPQAMAAMGREARRKYERLWTGDRNYDQLLGIYREAITSRKMGEQV